MSEETEHWLKYSSVGFASVDHASAKIPECSLSRSLSLTRLTDCLSKFFCSLRRTTMRASNRCFFFSSYSSACSFSLACCFFSISVRRFCAVEDELWDKVPSRAPNNLCPRLRSSNCPLLRRSDGWSCADVACKTTLVVSWPGSWLNRRRLTLLAETDDCLRFGGREEVRVSSMGSGTMTAEATALWMTHD